MSHQAPKLSPDSMMILEQSTLRVPVEAMRKTHRMASKGNDKELASLEKDLKKAKGPKMSKEDKLKAVDAALAKMRGIKRKVDDAQAAQESLVAASRARIAHLKQLNALTSFSSRSYTSWAHTRLQRHLVDYLLRRGYTGSAHLLREEEGLDGLDNVELDLFTEVQRIETALAGGSAAMALAWCKDNSTALKKGNSTLEFDLRFQQFIELTRKEKRAEAIQHCRKHLVPAAANVAGGGDRIRQAMALLAFPADTECPPYRALYDTKRWNSLAATFRRCFLQLYSLPPLPLLSLSLWAGLAALKLPSCISVNETEHNPDCPTCDHALLGSLATSREVPWGHHANSTIVCRITGKVLAGEDTVYALPNGMVYSGEAVEIMASKNGGKVKCPRTGEEYDSLSCKKVYIT